MRIYFERFIICDCGQSQRQTATEIPCDKIGKILTRILINEFLEGHEECNIKFTGWRVGKWNFRN